MLGEEEPFWPRVRAELARVPGTPRVREEAAAAGTVLDQRGAGVAGIAGDLLSSGERALVAVADVPRRQASLETLLAGMAPGLCLDVASWSALAAGVPSGCDHLVALDPPPAGISDPLLRLAPTGHAAWGPAEVEFALNVWRAELALRPALADAFRAIRALAPGASAEELERALCGTGPYPRSVECCARLLRVLTELGLVELALDEPRCSVVEGVRSDLELSPSYRAYRERLAGIERALVGELPAGRREVPVAQAS